MAHHVIINLNAPTSAIRNHILYTKKNLIRDRDMIFNTIMLFIYICN